MFAFCDKWVTVKVNEQSVVYKAIIPGVEKKDIAVSVTNEQLKIETKKETQFGNKFSYIDQYDYKHNYQIDNTKASYKNGVLTITIPKKEIPQQEINYIKID